MIFCLKILSHKYFNGGILVIIMLNTFFLALDRYPSPSNFESSLLSFLNLLFTVIFAFECAVKIIGLGFKEFRQDSFNTFDLVIVTISIT